MVKKLFKYEMLSYKRTLLPVQAILLGIAVLTRFVQFFESKNVAFSIFSTSSIIALCLASIVCLVMTFFFAISRFYKNLFTNEGYLSFTLPVTKQQHIFVKLTTAVLFTLISVAAVLLAICIATSGEVLVELVKSAVYIIKMIINYFGARAWVYAFEVILCALSIIIEIYLLFYACIAVGQLANKNRKLAAVGVYFGYYFVTQILGTIFIFICTIAVKWQFVKEILTYFENHPYFTIHFTIIGLTVFELILCFIYYLVTYLIIKKHLNLESGE